MAFRAQQKQVLRTIMSAGNRSKITITKKPEKAAFGGATLEQAKSITVYFCQMSTDNSQLEKNPNLVSKIKLLVSPIDENGEEIPNFMEVVRDKSSSVTYESGKTISIENARVTAPDGKTPIMARLILGG